MHIFLAYGNVKWVEGAMTFVRIHIHTPPAKPVIRQAAVCACSGTVCTDNTHQQVWVVKCLQLALTQEEFSVVVVSQVNVCSKLGQVRAHHSTGAC